MRIQADMYAVELGAALLLQFETPNGIVRVLADAGRKRYNVNDRINESIQVFGGDTLRIDLMIGTHYDADHLDGLVAIIENPKIEIGEAWLPPVANDTEFAAIGSSVRDDSLLALQFAAENGSDVLRRYLNDKVAACDVLARLEYQADEYRGIERRRMDRSPEVFERLQNFRYKAEAHELSREYFEAELADAAVTIGRDRADHGTEETTDPWRGDRLVKFSRGAQWWPIVEDTLSGSPVLAAVEAQSAALIRESKAQDAINASSLAAVVEALKRKKVKIRSAIIEDGEPRTFGWVGRVDGGRFEPALPADKDAPNLILLGPSESLVDKYRHELPVGTYLYAARLTTIPYAGITASNQLSYILVLEHQGQRILVSGDAGANDFMPSTSRNYFPKLISQLAPLHVVQVAHHGGANAYFYRVLLASSYVGQPETTHLLLSHKTRDSSRPSEAFSRFIAALRRSTASTQVLFTSKPQEAKVRDILSYIAPAVGTTADAGDIRLNYDGKGWSVAAHAVAVR